ncbi:hypothetical protein D3C84_1095780 [compost metagenome]
MRLLIFNDGFIDFYKVIIGFCLFFGYFTNCLNCNGLVGLQGVCERFCLASANFANFLDEAMRNVYVRVYLLERKERADEKGSD